jgi:hypothetical protein
LKYNILWILRRYIIQFAGAYWIIWFRFGGQWRSWIKACVFRENVLVNANLMKEINIQRGLKQGDPLSQF